METYRVFVLKSESMFFWTGRKWDLRPYNVKCYGTWTAAEKALVTAIKTAKDAKVVEATIQA